MPWGVFVSQTAAKTCSGRKNTGGSLSRRRSRKKAGRDSGDRYPSRIRSASSGKAEASAYTSSYTLSDIKQKLIRMAKEHGANAILVVALDHELDGQVRTDQVKNMSGPTWTPVDDSASDAREQRYMDLYSSAKDGELPVYKITIKAVFYKVPEQAQLKEPVMVGDVPPRKTPAPAPAAEQKKDESGKKADQN